MKYLLKLEWLKVKNHTPFWVFLGLFAFANMAGLLITHMVQNGGNMITELIMSNDPLAFPQVWHTSGWICGWALFLLGIYVITNVSNEMSFKTHRQNIIDGASRNQFLHGKWLMVLLLALFATLVYLLITVLYVAIFHTSSFPKMFEKNFWYVGLYFVEALLYLSLALFLGMVLRKTGLSVVIYIVFVWVADNLLSAWLCNMHIGAGRFLPIDAGDSMLNNPFLDFTKIGGDGANESGNQQAPPWGEVTDKLRLILCGVCLAYISIYYLITRWQFKKSDL
jgi:ABC-2 type transport system permease protein